MMAKEVRTTTLDMIRLGLQGIVDKAFIRGSVEVDYLLDQVRWSISGQLLGEKISRQEVRYPADWWQALKERWLPKWALRRWPVKYTTIVMDAEAIYPTFKPSLPDHTPVILTSQWEVPGELSSM